jgi:hypothetical protein
VWGGGGPWAGTSATGGIYAVVEGKRTPPKGIARLQAIIGGQESKDSINKIDLSVYSTKIIKKKF